MGHTPQENEAYLSKESGAQLTLLDEFREAFESDLSIITQI